MARLLLVPSTTLANLVPLRKLFFTACFGSAVLFAAFVRRLTQNSKGWGVAQAVRQNSFSGVFGAGPRGCCPEAYAGQLDGAAACVQAGTCPPALRRGLRILAVQLAVGWSKWSITRNCCCFLTGTRSYRLHRLRGKIWGRFWQPSVHT